MMNTEILSSREEEILQSVVQHFVLTGSPVGSRTLSKIGGGNLSAATIRNVMADLEEKGFLGHPHTSAGRIPTTKGYRLYVDGLVRLSRLTESEKNLIKENVGNFQGDFDFLLENTIGILAKISSQLGVVLTPRFEDGILEKIDIISVSSDKVLIILNIRDGMAKTILQELRKSISQEALNYVVAVLNERLGGLRIREIRTSLYARMKDVSFDDAGIIRLFIDSANKLFDYNRYSNIKYAGTSHIIHNPEFADVNKFSALVEFFEKKNIIIHMMEKMSDPPGLKVRIGDENEEQPIQECSIITAPYSMGNVEGLLGVIGPMRMAYRKIIPLVDYTAKMITGVFEEK